MMRGDRARQWVGWGLLAVGLLGEAGSVVAQDRLRTMPGYARYDSVRRTSRNAYKSGAVTGRWDSTSQHFDFRRDGKSLRFDLATGQVGEPPAEKPSAGGRGGEGGVPGRPDRPSGVERGRQADVAISPDKTLRAFYRDRNLYVSDPNGLLEQAITTDGNAERRIKCGKASWVYGEELYQPTAFWWSPDSRKIAYYRFDESPVNDYYLQLDQTQVQDKLDAEAYPKAGKPNPVVDLFVYDLKSKKTTRMDVRDGQPFTDEALGHYVYNVRWSPDGHELLYYRTNRWQNTLEFIAADPTSGKGRVVVREEWPASWIENNPEFRFLKDGHRFVWASQRSGFKNYQLCDLTPGSGSPILLTKNEFDAEKIVRLDEGTGELDYLGHDGTNTMMLQLHRARLDGSSDRRLTEPAYHHTVDVSPDGQAFVDVVQTHDQPPQTRVVRSETGAVVATLAQSDLTQFDKLGLKRAEMFTFKAGDGATELHGLLHKPSNYNPDVRYPVLVSVYGGPETSGVAESFVSPNTLTEFGFLVVTLEARSAAGRGKKFTDAIYLKLGQTEIDDLAAGVRSLRDRKDVDSNRVGIFGTSYGGSASLLCLLRYPDVFQAASAASGVTDFRNYDTIYTERYLRTPGENKAGYDAFSALTKADKLRGRLMIYYGTADDNVHPSNSLQLIRALNGAGKSYEVQVGPDEGHSAIPRDRMMEFFIDALVVGKP